MARPKSHTKPYHDRQLEAGRKLVQVYLSADLHERMTAIARKQGVPLTHVYAEAAADYADRAEKSEATALRMLFAGESPIPVVTA